MLQMHSVLSPKRSKIEAFHVGPEKQRVLVIEDDARLRELVCKGLREAGHTAMPASDGACGLEQATSFDFDSIILDIGLPERDGYSVANAIRAVKRVPILMLTARDSGEDILRGFEYGADDYLTKPFSFRELLARVHALGRSCARQQRQAAFLLDGHHLEVRYGGTTVQLTRNEFLLLSALQQYLGANVSRKVLMDSIWGDGHVVSANALEVLVNSARIKLAQANIANAILTVRGLGYRLQLPLGNDRSERSMHLA